MGRVVRGPLFFFFSVSPTRHVFRGVLSEHDTDVYCPLVDGYSTLARRPNQSDDAHVRLLPLGSSHHSHNAGLDGSGELLPGRDDQRQIRVVLRRIRQANRQDAFGRSRKWLWWQGVSAIRQLTLNQRVRGSSPWRCIAVDVGGIEFSAWSTAHSSARRKPVGKSSS